MGRQHQGMDRPRVRQVPEGSGEQGKMEKTGCKIIYGAPRTLSVEGLMMMMMMHIHGFMSSVHNCRSRVRLCTSFGGVDFLSWCCLQKANG